MKNSDRKAKLILSKALEGFNPSGVDNEEYLRFQIERLEDQAVMYAAGSMNKDLTPRMRARNRDLLMTARGLINGIKFSTSMLQFSGQNLMEIEGLDKLKKG